MGIDWGKILLPDTPILEIIVRGTILYLSLFLLLRFVLKRESGTLGITDLLVVVLLADAAQNAMAGQYTSVSDGLVLVTVIIFWDWALNWIGYHVPVFQRLVHPPPLRLIKNGEMNYRNMRVELITRNELESMLRQQGIDDVKNVKEAFLEGNGQISIVRKDGGEVNKTQDHPGA